MIPSSDNVVKFQSSAHGSTLRNELVTWNNLIFGFPPFQISEYFLS